MVAVEAVVQRKISVYIRHLTGPPVLQDEHFYTFCKGANEGIGNMILLAESLYLQMDWHDQQPYAVLISFYNRADLCLVRKREMSLGRKQGKSKNTVKLHLHFGYESRR